MLNFWKREIAQHSGLAAFVEKRSLSDLYKTTNHAFLIFYIFMVTTLLMNWDPDLPIFMDEVCRINVKLTDSL